MENMANNDSIFIIEKWIINNFSDDNFKMLKIRMHYDNRVKFDKNNTKDIEDLKNECKSILIKEYKNKNLLKPLNHG